MNYGINRRPLFETVKKHATSGTFLTAIICTFIYLGATCFMMGAIISFMLDILDQVQEIEPDAFAPYVVYIAIGFLCVMFIGALIISILLATKLLSVRSFFKGKSDNPNGLAGVIKVTKASYIFSGITGILPAVIMIVVMLITVPADAGIEVAVPLLLFVVPIYGAEIAGIIILYYFNFKGIRNTVNYAINAMNGNPEGKVSVFVIVMTIISLVSAAILVLYSFIFFIVGAIISFAAPMFITEFAAEFAPIASIFDIFMTMPLVSVPLLISQICYVKLLFGFKKDMETAKKEREQIQRQKAAIEAQKAVSTEENVSE